MPPVDQELLSKLERMENEKGLEIHGLLVGIHVMNYKLVQLLEVIILYFPSLGKSSSVPLSLLCTDWDGQNRVHDFLSRYDELISFAKQAADKQATGSPVTDGRGGYGMIRRY